MDPDKGGREKESEEEGPSKESEGGQPQRWLLKMTTQNKV